MPCTCSFIAVKVSSRVKNHNFSKFAIFTWLNRANQELSLKKNSRKKCFFCADLWSAKVFSMLIILIDRWQVLSYLIHMSLLNQANHAISDEGLFWKSIVAGEKLQEKLQEAVCCQFFQGSVELLENVSSKSGLGST